MLVAGDGAAGPEDVPARADQTVREIHAPQLRDGRGLRGGVPRATGAPLVPRLRLIAGTRVEGARPTTPLGPPVGPAQGTGRRIPPFPRGARPVLDDGEDAHGTSRVALRSDASRATRHVRLGEDGAGSEDPRDAGCPPRRALLLTDAAGADVALAAGLRSARLAPCLGHAPVGAGGRVAED